MRKRYENLLLLLVLILTISCESDEINFAKPVQGEWYQEAGEMENSNLSFRNEIIFRNNGTDEEVYLVVETANPEQIMGYRSLLLGEYEVTDNRLRRFNTEQYGLDDESDYLNREALTLESSDVGIPEVELSFNNSADQLTFDYCPGGPCPGFASYIEFQVYYRQK
ncbi:hypothetical protein WJR50_13100 [Catalinimonas sp. 4WD22]|uniref:hypothetical protein n=1 Tax=Catalinimonas locisalis TaxID=3133978 RepID=UPI003101130A